MLCCMLHFPFIVHPPEVFSPSFLVVDIFTKFFCLDWLCNINMETQKWSFSLSLSLKLKIDTIVNVFYSELNKNLSLN